MARRTAIGYSAMWCLRLRFEQPSLPSIAPEIMRANPKAGRKTSARMWLARIVGALARRN
jgi:hypothetical protein